MPYSLHAVLAVVGLALVAARPAEIVRPMTFVPMVGTVGRAEPVRPCGSCSDYPDEVEIYLHYFPNGAEEGLFLEMLGLSEPMGGPNAEMRAAPPRTSFNPDLYFCDALDPNWHPANGSIWRRSSGHAHLEMGMTHVTQLPLPISTSSRSWRRTACPFPIGRLLRSTALRFASPWLRHTWMCLGAVEE